MTINTKKKKPVYAGLSITHRQIEYGVYSPKTLTLEQVATAQVPQGLFDTERDLVMDPIILRDLITQVLKDVKPKPSQVHLSLPGTLLRVVEMPKMDPAALYLSLSSEAERYKVFDNTEASVDFVLIDNPNLPPNTTQLVLGAVRADSLAQYLGILKSKKIKAASISLEPISILRGLAGTGVLGSLFEQIGPEAHWGLIFVEPSRVRFSLWQCDQLVEFRELAMDTREFAYADQNPLVVEDLLEEIRRTIKNVHPALWLTHNMPATMEETLSQSLGCPVRTAPVGTSVMLSQPIELSGIGCVMTSAMDFPFDLDISGGAKAGGNALPGVASLPDEPEPDDGKSGMGWLIPVGIAALLLGGIVTGVLYLLSGMATGQIEAVKTKLDTVNTEVITLQAQEKELKKKVALDDRLIQVVKKAQVRNHAYVSLANELRQRTPEKLWVEELTVDETIELTGKALEHEAVLNFARSFDSVPFTRAIVLDTLEELKIGPTLLYDFVIKGRVNATDTGSGVKLMEPPAAASAKGV